MSDRPTPKTDAVLNTFNGVASTLAANLATHAEELERELAEAREENLEQARLLGMSGEREADLRGELEREKRRAEENGILAHDLGIQLTEAREEIATLRSEEQRLEAVAGSEATPYYQCKNSLRCRTCNGYWPDKCRCEKPQNTPDQPR